jgi:hypothetical protein
VKSMNIDDEIQRLRRELYGVYFKRQLSAIEEFEDIQGRIATLQKQKRQQRVNELTAQGIRASRTYAFRTFLNHGVRRRHWESYTG